MNYQFKERIEGLLKEKRNSKKSLYDYLGMSAQGFDYMLKNNTLTAKRVEEIAAFFSMSVAELTEADLQENVAEKPGEPSLFGNFEKLLDEFAKLREQLAVKDKQLEAADRKLEAAIETSRGLQRTIEALISRPGVAAGANFLNGVAAGRSVVRMHPATLAAGQVA
jgi:DNA-binding Xre family transcriptional regulator